MAVAFNSGDHKGGDWGANPGGGVDNLNFSSNSGRQGQ